MRAHWLSAAYRYRWGRYIVQNELLLRKLPDDYLETPCGMVLWQFHRDCLMQTEQMARLSTVMNRLKVRHLTLLVYAMVLCIAKDGSMWLRAARTRRALAAASLVFAEHGCRDILSTRA
jgi:hypothetical protein